MLVTPETEVRLLNNVPLNNTYEHQMTFTSKTNQANYFLSKSNQQNTFTDFTYVKEDGSVKVPRGRDTLYSCNYLMFKNKDFTDKWFYGFITKLEYVNPETTKVHFELDVFQTWQFDFEFRTSYVVREHTRRWNPDGSPVINTIDEGLDYGTDYETVKVEHFQPYKNIFFLVIVTKSAMHYSGGESFVNKINPTRNGLPQPLNYYIHPFKLDGSRPNVVVGGSSYDMSNILEVLEGLFTQEGAVDNVVSIYVTEFFENIAYSEGTDTLTFATNQYVRCSVADDNNRTINTIHVKDVGSYRSTFATIGEKYDGYHEVSESKLLMHPYTSLVLDDFKGNRVELKNEYINSNFIKLRFLGSLGTSNKVTYNVMNYLHESNNPVIGLENALINNNPNDLPILADMLSAYLQGNRNSIENQKNSIVFNAMMGTVGGAVIGGGVPGAMLGTVGGLATSYYQIEGLNAKKKDIMNTPPQMAKLGGNTAFDYGNGISGVYIVKKQITAEYRKRLGDFFKMFGYKVNELKVPNLRSRQHFNYIKTEGANLTGNVPQEDLGVIKRMFDNGVTLWHGDYVGDYSRSNGER